MLFQSTRDRAAAKISLEDAIIRGIADDGGLYVPEYIPSVGPEFIASLARMNYNEVAVKIVGLFADGFSGAELGDCVGRAYNSETFSSPEVVPLRELRDDARRLGAGTYVMELFHGPTAAFKDIALQLMPPMLTRCVKKTGGKDRIAILVATSGDTGKAALEGYRDVPGTSILVFYPKDGVSEVQKLQMVTQAGGNVAVAAVGGNFDDTQTGVKAIFGDADANAYLRERGIRLSSANSINWGRLMPQIVYYFWAYARLLADGAIHSGERIRFAVPSGNFGDILAGWYARAMGLPVSRFICASNMNNVLTDFINTGVYNRNRDFSVTMSPAMDILVSSNLERLLFELSGKDAARVADWMRLLRETGAYDVGPDIKDAVTGLFYGGYATEADTRAAVREMYERCGYLADTHTAVGFHVYQKFLASEAAAGAPDEKTVLIATASPYKFAGDVYRAIADGRGDLPPAPDDELLCAELLEAMSGVPIPAPLRNLRDRPRLHFTETSVSGMKETALRLICP